MSDSISKKESLKFPSAVKLMCRKDRFNTNAFKNRKGSL